jgi:hypothetical protein
MSKYSLINVMTSKGNLVSGYWIQDHHGCITSAKLAATQTMAVNGNKIDVAVVTQVDNVTPALDYFTDLIRL